MKNGTLFPFFTKLSGKERKRMLKRIILKKDKGSVDSMLFPMVFLILIVTCVSYFVHFSMIQSKGKEMDLCVENSLKKLSEESVDYQTYASADTLHDENYMGLIPTETILSNFKSSIRNTLNLSEGANLFDVGTAPSGSVVKGDVKIKKFVHYYNYRTRNTIQKDKINSDGTHSRDYSTSFQVTDDFTLSQKNKNMECVHVQLEYTVGGFMGVSQTVTKDYVIPVYTETNITDTDNYNFDFANDFEE